MEYLSFLGFLNPIPQFYQWLAVIIMALIYGYLAAPLWLWTLTGYVFILGMPMPGWVFIIYSIIMLVLNFPFLRRLLLTTPVIAVLKKFNFMPVISETERIAIEAGNVWVDGDLFSGRPDIKKLMKECYPSLTKEEKAFINGPVDELCRITNDWEVYKKRDLSATTWNYIKKNKFWGLIIPKKYNGHGFSALANSTIIQKLMSRCCPLAITVMVPNSLGPAELLLHFGTQKQKDYYLPRLATGEEIPCFALTEPMAGSDAGSIKANGLVFKGDDDKLYIRLNWEKRYITLAAISTILGLAFKLHDPENLLGKGLSPGITCALIPTRTKGVILGRRHDPLGVPFYNCPTKGNNVVVPVDAIIGGPAQAGNGWRMLMESLAAGRGISLPAASTGVTKYAARVTGAYSMVRQQFGLSIGKFEGIREPLARISGFTYLLDATRKFTCGAIDNGQKPAVITAIAKYNFTETMRKAVNDSMDILGGSGISLGRKNLMANNYFCLPINITVEGANILTRTLIIFGQGAVRCHPYAYKEIIALMNDDLNTFDATIWKHIGHIIALSIRSSLLSLSRGYLYINHPGGPMSKYYRRLSWASASFAFLADYAMGRYGGNLKRMEKLTGRFADIFSWLYIATAILKRFEAEGRKKEDMPLAVWTLQYAFATIQNSFDMIYQNFGFFFSLIIGTWSRLNILAKIPDDKLGSIIAGIIQKPGKQRNNLTSFIYIPKEKKESLAKLEETFTLVMESSQIMKKIFKAVKQKKLKKAKTIDLVMQALDLNIITRDEAQLLQKTEELRHDVIQVDSYTLKEYLGRERQKKAVI